MALLDASTWKKSSWLGTLYIILSITIIFYLLIHHYHDGKKYVELNKAQVQSVNNLIDNFPDPQDTNATARDSIIARDSIVMKFLESELDCSLPIGDESCLKSFMHNLKNKDLKSYLSEKKFPTTSYFWLMGTPTYVEVLLWALIGVLTSLIFYVSSANKNSASSNTENIDIGPFDPTEISGQVAKMFYAPIITLVLVIGYSLVNSSSSLVDISVGNGVIIFSFIGGFYSGRLMKFLDKLKDLLLPDTTSKPNQPIITVTASLTTTDDYKDITPEELSKSIVTLHPESGADISFTPDPKTKIFTAVNVPYGKYLLRATSSFSRNNENIALEAPEQSVEINADTKDPLQIVLDKKKDQNPIPGPNNPDNKDADKPADENTPQSNEQTTIPRDQKNYD